MTPLEYHAVSLFSALSEKAQEEILDLLRAMTGKGKNDFQKKESKLAV